MRHEAVGQFDEIVIMINGILHWLQMASTSRLTRYAMRAAQGSMAINAINILPRFQSRTVHDDLAAYFLYDLNHAVCNAHPLRSLLFLLERYPQKWIEPFKDLLLKTKARLERAQEKPLISLSTRQRNVFHQVYDQLVAQDLRANPSLSKKERKAGQRGRLRQSPARNLLLLFEEHKETVLAFMNDFNMQFGNDRVESDLRMMKVKKKISKGEGAPRSVPSTSVKSATIFL